MKTLSEIQVFHIHVNEKESRKIPTAYPNSQVIHKIDNAMKKIKMLT